MYSKGIGWKDMEWIRVAQNREKWRDVVNKIMVDLFDRQHRLIRGGGVAAAAASCLGLGP